MTVVTKEQLELVTDRRRLIESVVEIEDKDRQVVPFILNDIQADMHETSSNRDVYVKPAQVGGTTYIMCDFLLDCLTIPGTTSVIISYDEFITGRLLRKADSIYTHLKRKIPSIPDYKHKSTFEKTYEFVDSYGVKHGESSFYISSARSFSMPVGEPIHNLLLDELALWPEGSAIAVFATTLQRVPLTIRTKVRALSTPRGEEDFYRLYKTAKEGKALGGSVFKAHFYTWYQHKEFGLSSDNPFVLPGDDTELLGNLSGEETVLLKRFDQLEVPLLEAHNKLRWRRYKIAENMSLRASGETQFLFGQEYPEDDVSCFQVAGNQWHDPKEISEKARECYEAPYHNDFMDIWELPQEGERYLVSVDPGEGKKSLSVAQAWKFVGNECKHCATMAGLWEQDEMARRSKKFAHFYNEAMLAPEDALGFIGYIKDYPSLYYRTDPDSGMESRDIGWATTSSTKPYMCKEVNRLLPSIECHDIRVIEQCRNIKEKQSQGRIIPTSVGADDFYMAMAIALVCREAIPLYRGFVGQKGWSNSWGR